MPGNVAELPDPILPFSHPEFTPDQYNYPDSLVPEIPQTELTGSNYEPDKFDLSKNKPPMIIDEVEVPEVEVPIESENVELAKPVPELLQMSTNKSIDELIDEDDLFNAGPERFMS